MLDYEYMCGKSKPSVVAIVGGNRKQERYFWGESETIIPVVRSIDDLSPTQKADINVVMNVRSGRRVLSSMKEAVEHLPNLKIASIFAEQVPEIHAQEIGKLVRDKDIVVAGPASVGVLIPGVLKLGAIGGTQHPQIKKAKIIQSGDTAVISTSGGMVNELIHSVTSAGHRVSFAIALGGDRFPVTSPAEAFLLAEADDNTRRIVYFGELGGVDEYEIAELIKQKNVTKKVIAYIAGTVAELFDTPPQFGHAKALAQSNLETAQAKKQTLKGAGVTVLDTLANLGSTLSMEDRHMNEQPNESPEQTIGDRQKRLIVSRISGDKDGETQILGKNLNQRVEENSFAGLALSMLLGEHVTSTSLVNFTDHILRLLVDHGPYVAGATNTITSARAGKDLVSSLASGILTIGPRFGGAINESARAWLQGASLGTSAKEFVDSFKANNGIIPGIGHKKYRIDMPDPRLKSVFAFSDHTKGTYLKFAQSVEEVTTAKKGNLILNVDGAIAAVLLDLLESELSYDQTKLNELVDIEFFNALFVISRSVGFSAHYLDQRRHDEGLLRFSDKEILYLPEESNE